MSDVDPGERAFYAKPSFIAGAAILGLIVVGGGVAIGVNQLRADPPPSPSTSASAEPSESLVPSDPGSAAGDESVCGLTDSEEESSLTSAPETDWTFVGTIAAPTTDVGPGVIENDGFRYCYARTAEGALLSIANYIAISSEPSLRDRLTELLFNVGDTPTPSQEGGYRDTRLTIVGFRVLNYGPDEATIDLVLELNSAQDQLVAMPIRVFWHEGDWRFSLSSFESTLTTVSSLGGYVPWGPNGS